MRPSKEQAPRRAAEGLVGSKVQIRLHQAGDGSRQFLMPEGVEKLFFFVGWMLGEHGNTGTHDKISKLQQAQGIGWGC